MTYAIGIDIYGKEHKYEMNEFNNIWCQKEQLKSLIVYDEDDLLKNLYCYENQLEELTIIGGKNIHCISCHNNNNLKELNLSMCENLTDIACEFNLENGLILPNHKLEYIHFY